MMNSLVVLGVLLLLVFELEIMMKGLFVECFLVLVIDIYIYIYIWYSSGVIANTFHPS